MSNKLTWLPVSSTTQEGVQVTPRRLRVTPGAGLSCLNITIPTGLERYAATTLLGRLALIRAIALCPFALMLVKAVR